MIETKEKLPSPELVFSNGIAGNKNWASDGAILYQWNGQIWAPQDPASVEKQAFRWLSSQEEYKPRATPKIAASCASAALITARPLPKIEAKNKIVLPMQNGYLHVDFDAGAPLATPNCSTYGRSNCPRQDGRIMPIRRRWRCVRRPPSDGNFCPRTPAWRSGA